MYTIESKVVSPYETNCYFLTSGGETLVIDAGGDPQLLLPALAGKNVVGVVATHCHSDHIGAINEVVEAHPTAVMISETDKPGLTDTHLSGFDEEGIDYQVHQADRLLKEGDVVTWGDPASPEKLVVLETPGHTPGSICLYDEKNGVIFTGDTLFAGSIGATHYVGGDTAQILQSIRRLCQIPAATKVFPGHGPATDMATELRLNPWLRQFR